MGEIWPIKLKRVRAADLLLMDRYNGIVPQLGQAVLGAAIMMLAREKVATGVRRLIVG
eukprot:COSAG04_NODE_37_length_33905_cov_5.439951_2_plen_58_part_00